MNPLLTLIAASLLAGTASQARAAGAHAGEADIIEARVSFQHPAGRTIAGSSGLDYYIDGYGRIHEDKIYIKPYWGSYPLYFMGQTMRVSVTVSNKTEKGRKPFNVRVEAIHNVLETDGSAGRDLAASQEWEIGSLGPGQSVTKHLSVEIPVDPSIPSGLDLTQIRILHGNKGKNPDAGLIKVERAVWCPPDMVKPQD